MSTGRRVSGGLCACLALAVAFAACGSSGAPTSAGGRGTGPSPSNVVLPSGPFGHVGRWITDASGRVLLVHGLNMVEKVAPYYPSALGLSNADAAWMVANGFRVVRLGVLATGLMPTPGVVDAAYLDHVMADARMLERHGIMVLLDFHQDGWGPEIGSDGFPASLTFTGSAVDNHVGFPLYYAENPAVQQAFQSFWDDVPDGHGHGIQADYVAMFRALAARFARDPDVLGYDLFNEPWPGTTWMPCVDDAAGCPSLDASELDRLYARATAAIRATGDRHLVFGEPFVVFNFGVSTTSIALPGGDPDSGMSFHLYTLSPADEPAVLAHAVAWSARTGGALLNSEWGAVQDAPTIDRESGELDGALLPWIFWSFDGEVVHDLSRPPTGSNLVASTVGSLVQPYPLLVAGTPAALRFDPATNLMTFRWTTARPGGGHFEPGSLTTFEVPAARYPSGYRVTVTGGRVTSRPCAPLLTVATGRAATLSVEVEPGAC